MILQLYTSIVDLTFEVVRVEYVYTQLQRTASEQSNILSGLTRWQAVYFLFEFCGKI